MTLATALGRLKNLTLCMSSYCLLHSKFVITQQDFNIKSGFEFSFLNEILLNLTSVTFLHPVLCIVVELPDCNCGMEVNPMELGDDIVSRFHKF